MRRTPLRLLAAGTLPVLLLAGCGGSSGASGSGSSKPSAPSSTSAKPVVDSPMSAIKVDTKDPKKPAITLGKKPFQMNNTKVEQVTAGNGATVAPDQIVTVNYSVVNGTNGKVLADTFTKPVSIYLKDPTQFPGLVSAIKGKKLGTVEKVAIPPKDAFGAQGNPQLGVGPTDTLVFYMKITDAVKRVDVAAKSGLPTVKVNDATKPASITLPPSNPPKKLESANLVNGDGAVVKKGQSISVLYTGVIWANGKAGKVFDSSGAVPGQPANPQKVPGSPASFGIGSGQVIKGWDKTLVGKKVGDRVLIVIPPADGYGAKGNPQGGIKGTDTLVFVVDIVGAT